VRPYCQIKVYIVPRSCTEKLRCNAILKKATINIANKDTSRRLELADISRHDQDFKGHFRTFGKENAQRKPDVI